MSTTSTAAPRWAVTTRTTGEVAAVGVHVDRLDLTLLGVPTGFTSTEIEGWLRDQAGVALETSRSDTRPRPIPALLLHALTGLLFSHAELWRRSGSAEPCSGVFADSTEGAAFGWVGPARVSVRVEGALYEPQWVLVRDDEGREARAAVLPPGVRADITLEHWPTGEEDGAAPMAVEAEWSESPGGHHEAHAAAMEREQPIALPAIVNEPPAEPVVTRRDDGIMPALPESLPTSQPGLMFEPAVSAHETHAQAEPAPRPHPVGRWLEKLVGWGRRPANQPAPESAGDGVGTPISSYDALLSETPAAALTTSDPEQMALDGSPESGSEWRTLEQGAIAPAAPVAPSPAAMVHEPLVNAPVPPSVPARTPAAEPGAPLAPVGLSEVLGRNRIAVTRSTASAPEPQPQPAPPAGDRGPRADLMLPPAESLPVLASATPTDVAELEVVREPVGADEVAFAIPRLPEERLGVRSVPSEAHQDLRVERLEDSLQAVEAPVPAPTFAPAVAEASTAVEQPGTGVTQVTPMAMPAPEAPAVDESREPVARPSAWPTLEEPRRSVRAPRRALAWGAVVVVLFGTGWLIGSLQGRREGEPSALDRALRVVGLGAPHFSVALDTQPPGAWIRVDGRDMARRTPATLELAPGTRRITFSLPDLGEHTLEIQGERGASLTVNESLHGTLEVIASDPSVAISVSVDRKPMGFLPVTVESIEPGLHEVQFSGPGMPAWAQTVQVGVRRTAQVVAHPMTSPATGVLQVSATLDDESGSSPLSGAQVFIDGELKGVTPLSVELPRGPHSLRVAWHGESAPVQVIDLPGGNQRFATFAFGLDMEQPRLRPIDAPRVIEPAATLMVSAALDGLAPNQVREAWLHVRTRDGLWRRQPMSVLRGPRGAITTTVFPTNLVDPDSGTRWYMSAATQQGDDYFTEMQRSAMASAARPRTPRPPAETPSAP